MDHELVYILVCLIAFLIIDVLFRPKKTRNWRTLLWEYIYDVQRAREDGTLGRPRMRLIKGQLHVVGYGQCHRVHSAAEGKRVIVRLNQQAKDHEMARARLA
jgi:hypothetical protein